MAGMENSLLEYDYFLRNLLLKGTELMVKPVEEIYARLKEALIWRLSSSLYLEFKEDELVILPFPFPVWDLISELRKSQRNNVLALTPLNISKNFLRGADDKILLFENSSSFDFPLKPPKVANRPYSSIIFENPETISGKLYDAIQIKGVLEWYLNRNWQSAPPFLIYTIPQWKFIDDYAKYVDISHVFNLTSLEKHPDLLYFNMESIEGTSLRIWWMASPSSQLAKMLEKNIMEKYLVSAPYVMSVFALYFEDADFFAPMLDLYATFIKDMRAFIIKKIQDMRLENDIVIRDGDLISVINLTLKSAEAHLGDISTDKLFPLPLRDENTGQNTELSITLNLSEGIDKNFIEEFFKKLWGAIRRS